MKKTINTILAVTIAAVAMISCGNKTKDMLAKKWQLSEFKSAEFAKKNPKTTYKLGTKKNTKK